MRNINNSIFNAERAKFGIFLVGVGCIAFLGAGLSDAYGYAILTNALMIGGGALFGSGLTEVRHSISTIPTVDRFRIVFDNENNLNMHNLNNHARPRPVVSALNIEHQYVRSEIQEDIDRLADARMLSRIPSIGPHVQPVQNSPMLHQYNHVAVPALRLNNEAISRDENGEQVEGKASAPFYAGGYI